MPPQIYSFGMSRETAGTGVALRTCSFIKEIGDHQGSTLAVTLEGAAPDCYDQRDFLLNKTRAARATALPLPCRVVAVSHTP